MMVSEGKGKLSHGGDWFFIYVTGQKLPDGHVHVEIARATWVQRLCATSVAVLAFRQFPFRRVQVGLPNVCMCFLPFSAMSTSPPKSA